METPQLGRLLEGLERRDAIHVPIAPVIAGERLLPGQHVGVRNSAYADSQEPPIGIIDPYLKEPVEPGQRCYLLLYPGTVTSLLHVWSHPAFRPRSLEASP